MDIKLFIEQLMTKLPDEAIFIDEPMKKYTTFRVGGPADVLVKPTNIDELKETIDLAKAMAINYEVIGNGSNLLVSDAGYRGVIIQLANNFNKVEVHGEQIRAQAGALLVKIANKAQENSLTGFEFAHGIPGTLGGALVMNAGAYNGEMKQVVESVTLLDQEGEIQTLTNEALAFGYRTSKIQSSKWIVLEAVLKLQVGDKEAIGAYMKELAQRRKDKQPLDKPSAGSTFKRPEGYFAGKLIMEAGLKGCQIGDARVSDKHCGFVVNCGEATCQDIENLIAHVKSEVIKKFGVELTQEVKKIGE